MTFLSCVRSSEIKLDEVDVQLVDCVARTRQADRILECLLAHEWKSVIETFVVIMGVRFVSIVDGKGL